MNFLVISVSENGRELPGWLVLLFDLKGRLVWWSGIGSGGGDISIGKHLSGVSSVVLDGFEGPDWISGGGNTNKAGNSE